ncbi:MAG: CehA/McbA family metallohydrolase [Bacillota bacterium]
MKIDLHIHTANSGDATGEPKEVLAAAKKAGLDGIAITEHDCYEKSKFFLTLGPQFDLVVFVGAEVATRAGHMLVFSEDIQRWNSYRGINNDAQELIDEAVAAGGAVIAAHPYRLGLGFGGIAIKKLRGLTAIEACNGANSDEENRQALALAQKLDLPCTGGSDAHRLQEIGRCYTVFTAPARTVPELVAALQAGRCYCMAR